MSSAKTDLVILGAGDLAEDLTDLIEQINAESARYNFLGCLDNPSSPAAAQRSDILGGDDLLAELDARYVIAIASPTVRRRLDDHASTMGRAPATLVHPNARVSSDARLGPGTVILAGVHLGRGVITGRHTQINVAATIGHRCVLGDYVTLNPQAGLGANCRLGDGVTVGIGSVAMQGTTVGANSTIAAASGATRDIPADATAIGVPARILRLTAQHTSTVRPAGGTVTAAQDQPHYSGNNG